jgi:hypothetical protein
MVSWGSNVFPVLEDLIRSRVYRSIAASMLDSSVWTQVTGVIASLFAKLRLVAFRRYRNLRSITHGTCNFGNCHDDRVEIT